MKFVRTRPERLRSDHRGLALAMWLLAAGIFALVTLAACTTLSPEGPASDTRTSQSAPADPVTRTVTIDRSRFAPREITVGVGDSVVFVNRDPFAHTVTSAEQTRIEFDSGVLDESDSFDVQFEDAGTYRYSCLIHPTMRATVVVS